VVIGLGHDVIAREIYVKEVGAVTAREHPDVALVGLGSSSAHALDLISEIVREAACPVIAILHADDPTYVREAAKRGVFAYIIDGTPDSCRVRSTSRFSDSPSTRASKEHSGAGR
jgi:AmiR/NasT family two-component response regulator